MINKKVLIITYYWPPSGGSGVQRWLKFVKYLPDFGWQPFVFTPENPAFAIRDESLLKDVSPEAEVFHFPIWEPYEIFFKLSRIGGARRTAKPTDLVQPSNNNFLQRISTWLRGNFFIPDPRIFWVRPSAAFLQGFLKDNGIRTIVTTGPPHSLHLIGKKLKRKDPSLRWIADFRDPWSEWGLLDSLNAGTWARRLHRRLEAKVLSTADEILTITPFYVRQFETLGKRKVRLITNGFDEDDFRSMQHKRSDVFLIRHIGIINEKCDPRPFMRAVEALVNDNVGLAAKIKIEFIGEVHPSFRAFVDASPALSRVSVFRGNIPHKQLMELYGESSLLLLVLHGYKDAQGYMPGKLFEYLATGLPVMGIGPADGDAAALLDETAAGKMIDGGDDKGIREALLQYFGRWMNNETPVPGRTRGSRYSRRQITSTLADLLGGTQPENG